jgi:hypothetical protein
VATAQLLLCTIPSNVKPEEMCNISKKFIAASEVLVITELFFAQFERGMWLTLVTSFKQIPDATFLQLISKVHNMQPLITLKLYKL